MVFRYILNKKLMHYNKNFANFFQYKMENYKTFKYIIKIAIKKTKIVLEKS